VIDTPAVVSAERVAEIVPIGILNAVGVQFAKDVHEAPINGMIVGLARVDVEIHVVDALVRVVHVDCLGRDIEVSQPNHLILRAQMGVEEFAHTREPFQLVGILF
jgi:hypothetical protein